MGEQLSSDEDGAEILRMQTKALVCAASVLSSEKARVTPDDLETREWRSVIFCRSTLSDTGIVQIEGLFYKSVKEDLDLPQRLRLTENINCRLSVIESWGGDKINITHSYIAELSTSYDYEKYNELRFLRSPDVTLWLPREGSIPNEWLVTEPPTETKPELPSEKPTELEQWKHIYGLLDYAKRII